MRFVLRDSSQSDKRSLDEQYFGSISNIDFTHLKHVGLFRLHGGFAFTDDMKQPIEDKFGMIQGYSKYKVSMDTIAIHHIESEEIAKLNKQLELIEKER